MANKETITCDYKGCSKTFAYMVGPFALCSEHCWGEEQRGVIKGFFREWNEKRLKAAKAIVQLDSEGL